MFDNIGEKIKGLATAICWIGIIASVLVGFCIIILGGVYFYAGLHVFIGLVVLVIGPLLSWVCSFFMYGFGQLIENSDALVNLNKSQLKKMTLSTGDSSVENKTMVNHKPFSIEDIRVSKNEKKDYVFKCPYCGKEHFFPNKPDTFVCIHCNKGVTL